MPKMRKGQNHQAPSGKTPQLLRAKDGPQIRAHRKEGYVAKVQQPGKTHHNVEPQRQRGKGCHLEANLKQEGVFEADSRNDGNNGDSGQQELEPGFVGHVVDQQQTGEKQKAQQQRGWLTVEKTKIGPSGPASNRVINPSSERSRLVDLEPLDLPGCSLMAPP